MISLRRISLGGGYRYLMESVATGDGAARSNSLARYYAESGTPPGVFLGTGLADLDDGRGVATGSEVTEEHLRNMLAACADPISGEPLGRTPNSGAKTAPVAGFDFTFSPSKSVSAAWALAGQDTRAVIYDCHRRAVEYVLGYAEREMFHSRSGTNGIVEEDVTGVIAVAFTHWESRAGDPQLHDHVVVWNRAKSVSDGRWRTLDSRGLYRARSALSSMHQGVLSDYLTAALGVGWEARSRQHSDRPRWEIDGVPEALMAEFSHRVAQIEDAKQGLIARFAAAHGRQPSGVEIIQLRQHATLATRPDKVHRSLAEMDEEWRERATPYVLGDQAAWVASLKNRNDLPLLRAGDLAEGMMADAADAVVDAVAERRATFSRTNLLDDTHRLLQGVRFASPDDRIAVAGRIAELAVERSLKLTGPDLHQTPARYLRPDGSSRLRPRSREVYTTQALLDAEARLLEAGRRLGAPCLTMATVAAVTELDLPGKAHPLSVDQALAVEKIATSGRWLDVLIGPAGAGKSTTMAGLRAAWEAQWGAGSVVGLAPSAAAAEVLADELGVDTENSAKWLAEHRKLTARLAERDQLASHLAAQRHSLSVSAPQLGERLEALDRQIARWRLRPRQLLILDEASLAGTFALDEIMSAASDAGAKVLLSGDWAQLSAVDAGGAFALLVGDRADLAPELTHVHRFTADWERAASLELRLGREAAIDAYDTHGRISAGSREEMVQALYTAWKADVDAGMTSLMLAPDAATVAELNSRARDQRIATGAVSEQGPTVAGNQQVGVGDEVITRHNDRRLAAGRRWVRNGDRWVVVATNADGRMSVRRAGGSRVIVLPADYASEHVELAYACTAYRAQGKTVDTAHALVSPTTTREVLYVAATRGREANRLYVDTCYDPDPHTGHEGTSTPQTAREVLAGVLANEGAEVSAHETIRRAQHEAEGWVTLHAEYQTLAAAAQGERWEGLLENSGLSPTELDQIRSSATYGPLLAALSDAAARGLDVEAAFPRLIRARTLVDAEDVGAVLHGRVDRWAESTVSRRQPMGRLIAGLIPRAVGITAPDMVRAIEERERALEERARALAEAAIANRSVWARKLGPPPSQPAAREEWIRALATVAAYRERWGLGADQRPLGPDASVTTTEQLGHRKRAHAAAGRAMAISHQASEEASFVPAQAVPDAGFQREGGVGL
jgi:conjugative relaxase-like TrwC/TraI family protein